MEGVIEASGIYARGLIQCNQPLVFRVPHTKQKPAPGDSSLAGFEARIKKMFL